MTEQGLAIDVRDLTVAYRDKPVLWDIDFEVESGKLLAIVGPNGAGKTTLIKAILGLVKSAAGEILIYGKPYDKQRDLVEVKWGKKRVLLDPSQQLGKVLIQGIEATGKDANAGKATFVSLLGLDEAKRRASQLVESASDALSVYGNDATVLRDAAAFVVARKN